MFMLPLRLALLMKSIRLCHTRWHTIRVGHTVNVTLIHQGFTPAFARADSNDILDRIYKDDPVANLPCFRGFHNCLNGLVDVMFTENDIDLYAGKQINLIRPAAPVKYNTALTTMPTYLEYIHAHDTNFA